MMKKTAVLFVLFFLILVSCVPTGCGKEQAAPGQGTSGESEASHSSDDPAGNGTHADIEASQETVDDNNSKDAAIPDTNESAVSDWGVASAPADDPASESDKDDPDTSDRFAGQVIVDRDDLYFAIKEVKADAALGYTWKVYIENRTDKDLMFSFEKVAVNGVMCDPYWAEVVTAGKKGNCEIVWMRDSLEERQIGEVSQVDFTLNVYNDDDYSEAPLMHDPFTVYPHGEGIYPLSEGLKATAPATRQPAETDIVLVDNDDCAVVVTGFDPENSWGYAVYMYLQNKTEEDLIFSTENSSVNGIMCEPYWAEIVTAGNAAVSTILWDTASLSENGITQVKEISLPMRVYSDKDVANPYVEETFELRP